MNLFFREKFDCQFYTGIISILDVVSKVFIDFDSLSILLWFNFITFILFYFMFVIRLQQVFFFIEIIYKSEMGSAFSVSIPCSSHEVSIDFRTSRCDFFGEFKIQFGILFKIVS